MLILGIETSCDETAAAIVEDGTKILGDARSSIFNVNRQFGGVVPDKTAREQLKFILPIISDALATSNQQLATIDAIAVTYGPGLIGSLLVGVETAKSLAYALNKPIIPVNHLVGHIYANWLHSSQFTVETGSQKKSSTVNSVYREPSFPALVLLVSGAHSELVLMSDHGKFKLLGSTRDDAAGECFDKCGRLLGLPYPYGPYIEKLAQNYNGKIKINFPRPLINQKNWDFSFSGLKTAFLYAFQKNQPTEEFKSALAFELEEAITDVLVSKFLKASQTYETKSVIVCGGVAANKKLRAKMEKVFKKVFIPPINLCTDNAAYIASAAYFNYKPVPWQQITADPGLII